MYAIQTAVDLNRWYADIGSALARAAAADPVSEGTHYDTGKVVLAFVIEADGGITDIRVVESSGNYSLDRRATAKLRRAEPLPAGPEGAARRTQMIVMSVAERIAPAQPATRADKRAYA